MEKNTSSAFVITKQNRKRGDMKSSRVNGEAKSGGDSWNSCEGLLRWKIARRKIFDEKKENHKMMEKQTLLLKHVFYLFFCVLIHTRTASSLSMGSLSSFIFALRRRFLGLKWVGFFSSICFTPLGDVRCVSFNGALWVNSVDNFLAF